METINQHSTFFVSSSFTDKDGQPLVPNTVDYRIDDLTNGQEVLDWTSVTPASTVEITVLGSYNQIIKSSNLKEVKCITVRINEGTDAEARDELQYNVLNKAPSPGFHT